MDTQDSIGKDSIGKVSRERVNNKIPTLTDIKEYIKAENLNVNAEQFYDYYSSQKWKKANGRPLEDWKAACRYWSRTEKNKGLRRPATYDMASIKRNAENNTEI